MALASLILIIVIFIAVSVFAKATVPEGTDPLTEVAEGTRVGNQTLFGEYQDISYLEGYVQGRNVKTLDQFFRMNIPLIRSNNCQYYKNQRLSGLIDHSLEITRDISLGQTDQIRRQAVFPPFNDRQAKMYSAVDYVRAGKYVLGYPIVTDNTVDFEHYNDPDALDSSYAGGYFRDGAIEPLGVRNSFANTYSPDIRLTGIKGMFMPYHQEQGDWSDKKGSAVIDNKFEIRQAEYDWYEDAQDIAIPENVFARVGQKTVYKMGSFTAEESMYVFLSELSPGSFSMAQARDLAASNPAGVPASDSPYWASGTLGATMVSGESVYPAGVVDHYLSLWGYVSDGTYGMSPFEDASADEKYFKGAYRQLGPEASFQLLVSSSNTLSTIGSRFKSANCGNILRPKYDSVTQTVFGTDSIAFSGLLRD